MARIGRRMGWDAGKLRDEVRAARRQVHEIVRLDPRRHGAKIRGASSRYQGSLFGTLLLAEARRRIPAEPAEALALAEAALISSQNNRIYPTDPAIQAALAVAGNARRALGRLREAEADLLAWSRDDFRSAERLYTEARKRALARGIAWDAGLVGLELALAHLVQGRTRRVRKLALEALRVFAEQDVEQEIRAAFDLLEAAARRDALTRDLLERAIAALECARHTRQAPAREPS